MIALRKLDGKSLFNLLEKLKAFKSMQNGEEVTTALRNHGLQRQKRHHRASHGESR